MFDVKLSKIFDDYKIDEKTPYPIIKIIEVFKHLQQADYIHSNYKPGFLLLLVSQLTASIEMHFDNLKSGNLEGSASSLNSPGSSHSVKSAESPKTPTDKKQSKEKDTEQKTLLKHLKDLFKKITKQIDLPKGQTASDHLFQLALKNIPGFNLDSQQHSVLANLLKYFLNEAFIYLREQKSENKAINSHTENEINILQNLMISILTELDVNSVNQQSDIYQQRIIHIVGARFSSLAAADINALMKASRGEVTTESRQLMGIQTAEPFVTFSCDRILTHAANNRLAPDFLTDVTVKSLMQSSTRFLLLKNDPAVPFQQRVINVLDYLRDFLNDPERRINRKEAQPYWFFDAYTQVIYEQIEWLNRNLTREFHQDRQLTLARTAFRFNCTLLKRKENNLCKEQAFVSMPYYALLDEKTKDEIYANLDINAVQQKKLDSILTIKNQFEAIQNRVNQVCYFGADYKLLNKYLYILRTAREKGREELKGKIAFDLSKEFISFIVRLYQQYKYLHLNFLDSNPEFIAFLNTLIENDERNDELKSIIKKNPSLIYQITDFIIGMLRQPMVLSNFPDQYYHGKVDRRTAYANRLDSFPSAPTNVAGPDIEGKDACLINKTADGQYLTYNPQDFEDLTRIVTIVYNDMQPSQEDIFILAIGSQDGKDLKPYPDESCEIMFNGKKYRLSSREKTEERTYELFEIPEEKKAKPRKLRNVIVYNLETPDNGAVVVDNATERKLTYIYLQPHSIKHCHSTVGRSLSHQLAALGVQLIDQLHDPAIDQLLQILANPQQTINNSNQLEKARKLIALFNVDLNDREKCAAIARLLIDFPIALEKLYRAYNTMTDVDINIISEVFIRLLSGLRKLQYAVQESDQMLAAVGFACNYFARTRLNFDDNQIQSFKTALILAPNFSTFAAGFDVAEARLRAQAVATPSPASFGVPKQPGLPSFIIFPPSPTPASGPTLSPPKVRPMASNTNYSAMPPLSGTAAPTQFQISPPTSNNPQHYIALPDIQPISPSPKMPPAANPASAIYSPFPMFPAKQTTAVPAAQPNTVDSGNNTYTTLPPRHGASPQGFMPAPAPTPENAETKKPPNNTSSAQPFGKN